MDLPSGLSQAEAEAGARAAVCAWQKLPDYEAEPFAPDELELLLASLRATPPRISQVYLYDAAGCDLYEWITQLEHEYYLTAKETELLQEHAPDIAQPPLSSGSAREAAATQQPQPQPQPPLVLVELGAGTGRKTQLLLGALIRRASALVYTPIDVSSEALAANARACAAVLDEGGGAGGCAVELRALVGEFAARLPETAAGGGAHLYVYLGSSLGNFSDEESEELFRQVRACMRVGRGDRFLVGVDAPHSASKPPSVIERAYNDTSGVTAAFTLNALRHVNARAGTNFDWRQGWRHVAEYSQDLESIVTHVEAVGEQRVSRRGEMVRSFADGERIFMERSRKFSLAAMQRLAASSGLELTRHWTNGDRYHLMVELALAAEQDCNR